MFSRLSLGLLIATASLAAGSAVASTPSGCELALQELADTATIDPRAESLSLEAIETVFRTLSETEHLGSGALDRIVRYAELDQLEAVAEETDLDDGLRVPSYPNRIAERLKIDPEASPIQDLHVQLAGILDLRNYLLGQRVKELDQLVISRAKPNAEDVVFFINQLWPTTDLLLTRAIFVELAKNIVSKDGALRHAIRDARGVTLEQTMAYLVNLDRARLTLSAVPPKTLVNVSLHDLNQARIIFEKALKDSVIRYGEGIRDHLVKVAEIDRKDDVAAELRARNRAQLYQLGATHFGKAKRDLLQTVHQSTYAELHAAIKDGRLADVQRALTLRYVNPHIQSPPGGWLKLAGNEETRKFLETYLLYRW